MKGTYMYDELPVTYEVSHTEPVHPDPSIVSRFTEVRLSNCESGCKIYGDSHSNVRVLAHNSAYGCRK
jgi:hypothetical protein